MAYSTSDIRNIALVGQAGAGKTLLAEALLLEKLIGVGTVGVEGSGDDRRQSVGTVHRPCIGLRGVVGFAGRAEHVGAALGDRLLGHTVAAGAQDVAEHLRGVRAVLDEEDAPRRHRRRGLDLR